MTDINRSSITKCFLRSGNDIVRTVRVNTKKLLDKVSKLHPYLHFTLETTDDKTACHFRACQLTHNRRLQFFAQGIKNHQIMEQF